MPDLGIEFWRSAALYGLALGQTLFVILYFTFPWYKTFLGKALFFKAFVFAFVLDLALYARLNPEFTNWDVIFTCMYALLGVGVWFQFFAFLRVRTEGKRKERGERMASMGCESEDEPCEDESEPEGAR